MVRFLKRNLLLSAALAGLRTGYVPANHSGFTGPEQTGFFSSNFHALILYLALHPVITTIMTNKFPFDGNFLQIYPE
jgi:hypothetical protein